MKEFLNKHFGKLYWSILIIVIIAELGFIIVEFKIIDFFYNWLGLEIPAAYEPTDKQPLETALIIYRNRGLAVAAIVGAILTLIGFGFTTWGRRQTNKQIALSRAEIELSRAEIELSRKANASERYENAARMLGVEVLAVRIAGCHALENLGKGDEKIVNQCIQLLSTFIVNPLTDKDEIEKSKEAERLRQDTQTALNGLSAISKYYYEKNGDIVLDKADLRNANLEYADLRKANLTKANLYCADLTEANLTEADLTKADLTGAILIETGLARADLRDAILVNTDLTETNFFNANLTGTDLTGTDLTATDLTKSQILSAKFYDKIPPFLPEKLYDEKEIQEWLEKQMQSE